MGVSGLASPYAPCLGCLKMSSKLGGMKVAVCGLNLALPGLGPAEAEVGLVFAECDLFVLNPLTNLGFADCGLSDLDFADTGRLLLALE